MAKLAYTHGSISELSKSIRKQINSSHRIDIKQSEMLGILSCASGFQNYQSFKAKRENTQNEHLIELSFIPHNISEVFERDEDGVIQDRRHQNVHKVLISIPIKVKSAQQEAFFKINAWIDNTKLPERHSKDPEHFLANAVIDFFQSKKGYSFLSKLNMCRVTEICVNDNINKQTRIGDKNKFDEFIFTVTVNQNTYPHLNAQITKVTEAIDAFEYSIEQLQELAFHIPLEDVSRDLQQQIHCWVYFIERSISIVSESNAGSMYGWNTEKFPTIKKVMLQIANNEETEFSDEEFVKRNLYVMSASDVWVDEPPTIEGIYI
ncbi:hypothetical protein A9Q75_01520 [Colwellia psychrerythraea]|uniref:Uncharacterized protein n=1 Tax=Colwellia psychrerythraea TaxID=28229 RepID=A0A1Y5EQA5_COLPS|nr:hypothetical protein A9Q75_01520 [Colwellia psychrerythraea]